MAEIDFGEQVIPFWGSGFVGAYFEFICQHFVLTLTQAIRPRVIRCRPDLFDFEDVADSGRHPLELLPSVR